MIKNRNCDFSPAFQFPTAASDPASAKNLAEGMVYYKTDTDVLRKYNGSAWSNVTGGATGDITSVVAGAGLTDGGVTGDVTLNVANTDGKITVGANSIDITAGSLVDADVSAQAAIAYSKLALAGAVVNADLAGSIAAGKLTLATGSIFVGAAGVGSAVDAKGDGKILIGDSSTLASVAVTGDLAITNAGVTEVSDLTIASEAQGDVLFFDSNNWVRLAAGVSGKFLKTQGAGSNPIWDTASAGTASGLASPFTIEGGANDPSTTVTAQTAGAANLTIPDLANVAQEWVFSKKAQTLEAKTLTLPKIATGGKIVDANGAEWIEFLEDATPVDHLLITQGDAGVGLTLTATSSGANAGGLLLDAKGTGDIEILDGTELTFRRSTFDALIEVTDQTGEDHTFTIPDISTGAADTFAFLAEAQTFTNKTLTTPVVASFYQDAGKTKLVTSPAATCTLVGKDTTDIFTNKSFDCDGTNNALTNVNATELDPIAFGTGEFVIPIILGKDVSNSADVTVIASTTYKMRIIDAWTVATGAGNSGTWKITDGSNDITETVAHGTTDNDISRAAAILDAQHEPAATTAIHCINSVATDDAILYILAIRVD